MFVTTHIDLDQLDSSRADGVHLCRPVAFGKQDLPSAHTIQPHPVADGFDSRGANTRFLQTVEEQTVSAVGGPHLAAVRVAGQHIYFP